MKDNDIENINDGNIILNGSLVMVTSDFSSNTMETFIKLVREISEQSVDWGFTGGRILIYAIGDLYKVEKTLKQLMPMMAIIHDLKWKYKNPNVNTLDRLLSQITILIDE